MEERHRYTWKGRGAWKQKRSAHMTNHEDHTSEEPMGDDECQRTWRPLNTRHDLSERQVKVLRGPEGPWS